jgi:hypothetical protein
MKISKERLKNRHILIHICIVQYIEECSNDCCVTVLYIQSCGFLSKFYQVENIKCYLVVENSPWSNFTNRQKSGEFLNECQPSRKMR